MKELLGLWMTDPESDYEQVVTMEFKEDGQLIYTLMGKKEDYIALLTYCIESDILITDQPSAPREARGNFYITPEDKLILVYNNVSHQYVRVPPFNPSLIN